MSVAEQRFGFGYEGIPSFCRMPMRPLPGYA